MIHVTVVGAGAFGGWTALWLLRRGARVTLLDAWGPGNSRASSGGETRVTRAVYGTDRVYIDWVARGLSLWRESEARWGQKLYRQTGALWMFGTDDDYARASLPLIQDAGLSASELTVAEARGRFPQIDFAGVRTAFWEEEAGYLLARRACQAVVAGFVAEGGEYRQLAVAPPLFTGEALEHLELSDGSALAADAYVFACGPWLGRLFPDVLGERAILPTRQEVFYFGTPPGDPRYLEGSCPIWIDIGDGSSFYGIPGNENRGFKVADDTRGEPFDPTDGDRVPTPAFVERSRAWLAHRFPGMAGAPLLEARVCQYENSPDGQLLFDRHPHAGNVWLLGGGSGHGFKLGPPLGQDVAGVILGDLQAPEAFALSRLRQVEDTPFKTQLLGRA